MKKKRIINFSFLAMFAGFLVSLSGIFGNKVTADQTIASTSGGMTFLWILLTVIGLVFVLVGLLGFISAIASSEK